MTAACEKAERLKIDDMMELIVRQVGKQTVDAKIAREWEKACLRIAGKKAYRKMRIPRVADIIYAYPELYDEVVYGKS